MVINISAVV